MARKVTNYTVQAEGRDKGKTFVITEMSSAQAESWAMRAILALIAGGVNLPDGFERMGMAGMAELGIRALSGLKWEVAKPLLDEMWQCIQAMPDPSKPHVLLSISVYDEQIEEVTTRFNLRAAVWELHTGFSVAAALSDSDGMPAVAAKKNFAEYQNVPAIIATLISKRMATLHELGTVYGTQDAYDMLEIVVVDAHNQMIANQE